MDKTIDFNKLPFRELKKILVGKTLAKDDEYLVRKIMKEKIIKHKKNILISLLNCNNDNIRDNSDNSDNKYSNKNNINLIPHELADDRYNIELAKDEMNANLTNRLNNEFQFIKNKIPKKNVKVESPYDNILPLKDSTLSSKENVFKNVKCSKAK